jgi:hypothetical protein
LDERLKILEEKVGLHAGQIRDHASLSDTVIDRCCQRSGPTSSVRTPTGGSIT